MSTLIGLAFTLPAMIIAGFLLFYHSLGARQFLAEEGVRYGDMLADQLLSASQRLLRLGSQSAVQEVIEETGSKRSVVYVALMGKDGTVLASSRRDWIGRPASCIPDPDFAALAAAATATAQPQHRVVDHGRRMILVSPLLLEGVNPNLYNLGGLLCLKVDQERQLYAIYAGIVKRGIVSALGILLISLLLLAWARSNLVQPILRLAAFARSVAAGAVVRTPHIVGPLEVAQLTEDVGRMVEDLARQQAALSDSVERHRRLLEGAYDAILTADPETGRILEANRMFCRLFGYQPEEIHDLTLSDLHPPDERARLMEAYKAASVAPEHGGFHGLPCVRKDGERFLVDASGGPISLENRTVTEWILRDTTERRALEDQLRQVQKLESVGTLAGGIAHDFNNLLTGILGYTRLVKGRLPVEDANRKKLELIEKSAMRAAELTAQLLTFSRRAATRQAPTDLNDTVTRVVEDLRGKMPPAIEVVFEGAADLWTASADVGMLEQMLLHLCANAREAMPQGRLLIATANRTITAADRQTNLEARPGRFVTLTVKDNGRGIDPAILPRVFEPFFTTKGLGQGAGMGLAIVHGAVKGHDGWIEATSEPGRGSCFVVHFPVWDPEVAARRVATASPSDLLERLAGVAPARRAASDPAPPGRSGPQRTVLAVDDESTVLALARDILEMHGYKVLTARNGEEALRVYGKHAGGIDLVLLDLTMPVMGGLECFRRLRQIDARVRVLVSSGFSSESTATEMMRDGAVAYVQKPYDIDALARIVRQVIDQAPGLAVAHPN